MKGTLVAPLLAATVTAYAAQPSFTDRFPSVTMQPEAAEFINYADAHLGGISLGSTDAEVQNVRVNIMAQRYDTTRHAENMRAAETLSSLGISGMTFADAIYFGKYTSEDGLQAIHDSGYDLRGSMERVAQFQRMHDIVQDGDHTKTLVDDHGLVSRSVHLRYSKPLLADVADGIDPDRPVVLAVTALADRNGVFMHNKRRFDALNDEYQVIVYEAETEQDLYKAIEHVASTTPIHTLIIAAHGSPFAMSLGTSASVEMESGVFNEQYLVDMSDFSDFAALRAYLADTQIILNSCSTAGIPGEGVAHMISAATGQAVQATTDDSSGALTQLEVSADGFQFEQRNIVDQPIDTFVSGYSNLGAVTATLQGVAVPDAQLAAFGNTTTLAELQSLVAFHLAQESDVDLEALTCAEEQMLKDRDYSHCFDPGLTN